MKKTYKKNLMSLINFFFVIQNVYSVLGGPLYHEHIEHRFTLMTKKNKAPIRNVARSRKRRDKHSFINSSIYS